MYMNNNFILKILSFGFGVHFSKLYHLFYHFVKMSSATCYFLPDLALLVSLFVSRNSNVKLLFTFDSYWDSLNVKESYSKWLSIPSAVNLSWLAPQNCFKFKNLTVLIENRILKYNKNYFNLIVLVKLKHEYWVYNKIYYRVG
jgi:hypothetical protein